MISERKLEGNFKIWNRLLTWLKLLKNLFEFCLTAFFLHFNHVMEFFQLFILKKRDFFLRNGSAQQTMNGLLLLLAKTDFGGYRL